MAFKLTKDEKTEFEKHKKTLAEAFSDLTSAVDNYNEEIDKLRDEVGTALEKYNTELLGLRGFVDDKAATWRDEYDEKSDTWKEEEGSDIDEWISTWESADLDDATIEFPDELQIDFEDHSETELPSEP
jgi:hypothetical protein